MNLAYNPTGATSSEHRYLWDARQSTGARVPTGSYEYLAVMTTIHDSILAGSATPLAIDAVQRSETRGRILIDNRTGSSLGAGWSLDDLEEIIANPDGSVLHVTGSGMFTQYKKGHALAVNAGSLGQSGSGGDGGPASRAGVGYPTSMIADPARRVILAGTRNHRIRMVDLDGIVEAVAGTGAAGSGGDGGPALAADLALPTHLTADGSGKIQSIIDPAGRVTQLTIDAAGDLTRIQFPDASAWTCTYQDHRMIEEIDPGGVRVTLEYGPTDPVGATTRMVHDGRGLLTRSTDPRGHTTLYTHPPEGNVVTVTDAPGRVTVFEHDGTGDVSGVTNSRGFRTGFTNDAMGRRVRRTDTRGGERIWNFDESGNLVREVDEMGRETTHAYDERNRRFRTTNPQGDTRPEGGVHETGYDALDNRTFEHDPEGRTRRMIWDAELNRLTSITQAAGTPDEATSGSGYDPRGNRTSLTNGETVTYNAVGNQLTVSDGSEPRCGSTVTPRRLTGGISTTAWR